MPAALPGYLAGLKQGWAFSWRSLMAAEIIASSPDLGVGLGQLLENGRNNASMSQVFLAILLILLVGIAIDLLIFSPSNAASCAAEACWQGAEPHVPPAGSPRHRPRQP